MPIEEEFSLSRLDPPVRILPPGVKVGSDGAPWRCSCPFCWTWRRLFGRFRSRDE